MQEMQTLKSAPHKLPILVAGPTGAGKTAFAVDLAQRVGGEIVCADAFQVYEGMGVLTAQPGSTERCGVPHHLFGCIDPATSWDVVSWLAQVEKIVEGIALRGGVPVLVGGTGLFFKAFTHGLDPAPKGNEELRRELEALPLKELCERLHRLDPDAGRMVDLKNPRRVQRALEIVALSGKPLAAFRSAWTEPGRPVAEAVWLSREREELRARIATNVDRMLGTGAVDEVRVLRQRTLGPTAVRAIGFKEILAMLDGEMRQDTCREKIITATCQYARRQETWFRKQTNFTRKEVAS